jgi:hypothetical protein
MTKAAAKQRAKAAIKLAKPKGNSKSHAAQPKKLVMAKNGVHLIEVMTILVRNLMKDLVREPRKPPRLKKLWKRMLRLRRLLMMMRRRKGKKADSDTEEDEVTLQCKQNNTYIAVIGSE